MTWDDRQREHCIMEKRVRYWDGNNRNVIIVGCDRESRGRSTQSRHGKLVADADGWH